MKTTNKKMTDKTTFNEQQLNEILNPLDRSEARLNKIREYIRENATWEYWEQTNGEQRTIWLKHYFPYHPSPNRNRYYSECYLYKKNDNIIDNEQIEQIKGTRELIERLANTIFNEN